MTELDFRKIIHVDMDAFYASVEQRDFPEYRGKPIAVGGSPKGRGGVVATASYEARKFGIHSAMPSKTALRLCPDIMFIRPRFNVYKAVSRKIHEIFHRYTDLVEPLSLDEAYLDVTHDKQGIGYAMDIARLIKKNIKTELNLTASAGVSINKFVAKIASDMDKPNGLTFIGPSKIKPFMESLPVEKFFGVGKVTAAKMKSLGWQTGYDLKQVSEPVLVQHFGKTGHFYYQIVRGIDNRPVRAHRERKSISVETTFQEDLADKAIMWASLEQLTTRLVEKMQQLHLKGKTVTVKFKFHDFQIMTRSCSMDKPSDNLKIIRSVVKAILDKEPLVQKRIRLLGVGLSHFDSELRDKTTNNVIQLDLF